MMARHRFINPYQQKINRGLTHFLLWQIGYYKDLVPPPCIPENFAYPNSIEEVNSSSPSVTWINHSTFWVKAYGKNFLIDPIWNYRCSPLPFLGPKRKHAPSPMVTELDEIDYVIISHNHYDHLDKKSVYQLHYYYPKITWIVPLGVKGWLFRHLPRFKRKWIIELNWWENLPLDGGTLTAVPAQHYSGRGFFDRNRTLWMGCVFSFSSGKRFYFAGDTGYNPFDFKEIGKYFGPIDLSLIPIGVYSPRSFMKSVHVNPKESLLIHGDVQSKLSVASHWGTFRLSNEALHQPPYDLYIAMQKAEVPTNHFRVLKPGQSINW